MENFNKDSILVASDANISPGKLTALRSRIRIKKEVAEGRKLAQPTL
jgi:hypothetical protein